MRTIYWLPLFALALSACGGNSNVEPPAPLSEFTPLASAQKIWETDSGAGSNTVYLPFAPAIADGIAFTVSPKGHVRSFSLQSGATQWRTRLDIDISASPGVGGDTVVVCGHGGELVALNAKTGKKRWETRISSEILAAPLVTNALVSVRSVDGKLTTLSAAEGAVLWTYEENVPLLSLRGSSGVTQFAEFVVSGFDNGRLVALNSATGKLEWRVKIAEARGRTELERMIDIDMTPVIEGYAMYAATYQGYLASVSPLTGKIGWKQEVSSYTGLAVDIQALYLTNTDGHVLSYARNTGDVLWKQDKLETRKLTAPAIHGDYCVVGDLEGYLHWLRREDGRLAARYRVSSSPIQSAPISVNDMLVVQSTDGDVVALRLGAEKK
jgi:outer membrane protein assembly factor BamB